jgi:hypothetical protein
MFTTFFLFLDPIYLEHAPFGIPLPFTKLYQESLNRKKAKKPLPLSSRLIVITECRVVDSRYAWFVNTQFFMYILFGFVILIHSHMYLSYFYSFFRFQIVYHYG